MEGLGLMTKATMLIESFIRLLIQTRLTLVRPNLQIIQDFFYTLATILLAVIQNIYGLALMLIIWLIKLPKADKKDFHKILAHVANLQWIKLEKFENLGKMA